MTWRDDLRRVTITISGKKRNLVGASFRGVPFLVEESERSGGRRIVTHDFPYRDDPFIEDLGRKSRTFNVTGYLLGDDYLTQRDALLSVLEDASGPGQLVHPYYGLKTAIAGQLSVRETKTDGGYAAFSIEFAEAPAQTPTPVAVADPVGQVSDAADAAQAASKAELASKFDIAGLPGYALQSAQDAIEKASGALTKFLAPVVSATQELANLNAQATILSASAQELVDTPAFAMDQLQAAIDALTTTASSAPEALMDVLIDSYGVDLGGAVTPTTPARTQEAANQTAIQAAIRRTFAIEAARLAPTVPFVTVDDALAARDSITALLDAEALVADDTAYGPLVDLRAQVQQAVPGTSAFASVITIARKTPVSSLVLAYQLYGAVELEQDIIDRNDISNPGFVVGDLKVLSDAE